MHSQRQAAISSRRQSGLSVLGMIASVAVVGSLIVLALRLGPHYIDFYTMRAVMKELPSSQIHTMDKSAIREMLEKRFLINNLRSFKVKDVVKINRDKDATNILIKYEIREHLVANVDAVLMFNEQYSYQ